MRMLVVLSSRKTKKRRHFTVEFLVGERLEHLKRSHLALEADDLIPEHTMQHVYGKEPERQVGTSYIWGHRRVARQRGGKVLLLHSKPGI